MMEEERLTGKQSSCVYIIDLAELEWSRRLMHIILEVSPTPNQWQTAGMNVD